MSFQTSGSSATFTLSPAANCSVDGMNGAPDGEGRGKEGGREGEREEKREGERERRKKCGMKIERECTVSEIRV